MTQKKQSDVSDLRTQRSIKIWLAVFVSVMLICFFYDAFVLHPIPRLPQVDGDSSLLSDESAMELVHSVYPDAMIQDQLSKGQFLVTVNGETRLLWFRMFTPFCRWKLNGDLLIPENATGTFTYGSQFNKGTVELENGKVIENRTPFLTWKLVSSFYLLIATLTASAALIPVWVIGENKKK